MESLVEAESSDAEHTGFQDKVENQEEMHPL
jgi:hypothetical protein